MKTNRILLSISILGLAVQGLVGCGSNSSTGTTAATSYYLSNGSCYANTGTIVASTYCTSSTYTLSNGTCYGSTGTAVATTYCTSTSTTGYTLSNGSCYSTSTGQIVSVTYCSSTSTSGSQCIGTYYYPTAYGYQPVSCTGSNCRGYTLYSSAGVPTYCQ